MPLPPWWGTADEIGDAARLREALTRLAAALADPKSAECRSAATMQRDGARKLRAKLFEVSGPNKVAQAQAELRASGAYASFG